MRERARNQRRYWKDPIAAARRNEEHKRQARIERMTKQLESM